MLPDQLGSIHSIDASLMYATQGNQLFINLFASDKARVDLGKTTVRIEQQTNYPWDGGIRMTISPEKATTFAVKVRIPGWVRNEVMPSQLYSYVNEKPDQAILQINGKPVTIQLENGYATISRRWQAGDAIDLKLPMNVRRVVASKDVKEDQGKVALEYGPVVYCVEAADNPTIRELTLPDAAALRVSYQPDLLNGINVITGTVSTTAGTPAPLKAIPYYAWSNRGVGVMNVWLPRR